MYARLIYKIRTNQNLELLITLCSFICTHKDDSDSFLLSRRADWQLMSKFINGIIIQVTSWWSVILWL